MQDQQKNSRKTGAAVRWPLEKARQDNRGDSVATMKQHRAVKGR